MIKSMTGFARKQIQHDVGILTWEIRSLNSRYLDLNFYLPDIFRELEPVLREKAKAVLQRGKVDCTLRYQAGLSISEEIILNQPWLEKMSVIASQMKTTFQQSLNLNLTDLLRWPGAIQTTIKEPSALHTLARETFEITLQELDTKRTDEGRLLERILLERLDQLAIPLTVVRKHFPEIIELQKQSLMKRLEDLKMETDRSRLEQEMVYWADRADITEEMDRLGLHIETVKKVLKTETQNIGRRLDFLMQELHREANTLGSKSMHDITTQASVDMKILIEQMKEQIQNVE